MKNIYKIRSESEPNPITNLRRMQLVCGLGYERLLRRLAVIRGQVERKFARATEGYEKLLSSALNEAEALAWQTPYPHLFFPELAQEKAAAVRDWTIHQRAVQAREQVQALAA